MSDYSLELAALPRIFPNLLDSPAHNSEIQWAMPAYSDGHKSNVTKTQAEVTSFWDQFARRLT